MTFRKFAGLATVLLMMVAMLPLVGLGQANPTTECASPDWNGEYWKIQVNNGDLGGIESNVGNSAINLSSDGSWTNNHDNPVFRIILKVGGGVGSDVIHEPPVNPIDLDTKGLSHVTFCFTETTTTTSSSTSTSTSSTTSTTEASTTTTEEETTTTTEEETTTTTEESTTTTEEETTTTTEDESTTTTEQDTTTTTEEDVAGETTSTTESEVEGETTSTTEADETEDTLPFTGIGTDGIALAALIALASGAGLIFLTRRSAESEIDV